MKDKFEKNKRIGKKGALVIMGLFAVIMLSPSVTAPQIIGDHILMGDDEWIGLDPGGRIIFDNQATDEIEIVDARLGIGDTSPDFKLEVTGSSGSGYFGVTEYSDGDIFIIDSNGRVGIGTASPGTRLDVHGGATIGDHFCSAPGSYAIAMGQETYAEGDASVAMGWDTIASGDCSVAMGALNTEASGFGSIAIGWDSEASEFFSVAIGVRAIANGVFSCAMGTDVTASNIDSYVIGRGAYDSTPLVNNIQSSFMVGFDSTTPTLFVDGTSVGIGTTTPGSRLEIKGTGVSYLSSALHVKNSAESSLLYVGDDGKVGIGIESPSTTLHVDGDVTFGKGENLEVDDNGEITVTHSYHWVDDAVSPIDYLDTIKGYEVAGQVLVIRPVSSNTVTVLDNYPGGNLQLEGNFVMDNANDSLVLIYDGTNWNELSRSNNGS